MVQIFAPCAGHVVPITDVADPVFNSQTVGPGLGIEPGGGRQVVVAPANGRLLTVSPHAFILLVGDETGILVHIGIDTVRLAGEGFEVLAAQGDVVAAGTPIVAWDPDRVTAPDMARTVLVVVMDAAPDTISEAAVGAVATGDPFFTC